MQKNGKFIKCKVCNKEFYISLSRFKLRKYCSTDCAKSDNYGFKPKSKKCVICGKSFLIKTGIEVMKKTCSYGCHCELARQISKKHNQKNRIKKRKKDWDNYKDGKQVKRGVHSRACYNYRKSFKEKYGYLFCENCGCNINGTARFETHHIYYASRYPNHKELHNHKNLILVCTTCHHKFHDGKCNDKVKQLEKERGLKDLFNPANK